MSRGNVGPEPLGGYPNSDVRVRVEEKHRDIGTRVYWPAIIAGLFAALSMLTVLVVLGSAIGLSAMEQGDNLRNYAMGAGWWAALSGLIAFAFGGWIAARNSPGYSPSSGWINGSMVWTVAIPLTLLLAGGVASIAGTAAATRNPTGQFSSAQQGQDMSGSMADQARQAGSHLSDQVTPSMANASSTSAKTAWATLISLVLGFLAATLGGYLGTRVDNNVETVTRTSTGTNPGYPAL